MPVVGFLIKLPIQGNISAEGIKLECERRTKIKHSLCLGCWFFLPSPYAATAGFSSAKHSASVKWICPPLFGCTRPRYRAVEIVRPGYRIVSITPARTFNPGPSLYVPKDSPATA